MRYRTLRRLHLWVSLLVAVPLVVLSLTGALLVYGPEIQRLLDGEARNTGPVGASLAPTVIVDRVAQQRPDVRIWSVSFTEVHALTAWLADGAGVLRIDPRTGDILDHFHPKDRFQGWVTALHRRWLVDGPYAKWVRHGTSAVALLLTVQLVLGLWLWLKPPAPFKRLKLVTGQGARVATLRLHQASGVATALILIAVTFTGMAMWWHAPAEKLVEWATFSQIDHADPPKGLSLAPIADLDAAVEVARTALPGATVKHVRPPDRPGAPAIVGLGVDGQLVPSRVWVGDDPPRVIYAYDGSDVSLATKVWHLRYPIHVGDFAGPVVRAVWVVIALLPAAFVVTGLWLYLGRRSRESRSRPPTMLLAK